MANPSLPGMKELNPLLAPYQKPSWKAAAWQLINSVLPFLAGLALMGYSLRYPYWFTLLLAIPTAGFMIRTFILFHDCGHNSFTPSLKANRIIGFFLGILVFTPSDQWWKAHAIHHATSSNLDKRGTGDVATMTIDEYKSKKFLEKAGYRLFRFPPVMFGLGPFGMFLFSHRLPIPRFSRRETMSVVWNNLGLVVYLAALSFLFGGFWNMVIVYLPVLWLAGMAGIWLFYIQHQFDGVYWSRDKEWDYVASALKGASYYRLPRVLQFFSGNIGFHHIHHLSPRIPNYRLEECHSSDPVFRDQVRTINLAESLRLVRLALIDESNANRMVAFQDILG